MYIEPPSGNICVNKHFDLLCRNSSFISTIHFSMLYLFLSKTKISDIVVFLLKTSHLVYLSFIIKTTNILY